ncbi:bacterio-opsin activator [Thermocrinis sp.]|uniref:bacterio-opsin activator n=1 Tax=Thermocrinis sp. TaxID=2024383 RepID=UPI002FDC9093
MNLHFKPSEDNTEVLVLRVFLKSVEILGGLQNLVKHKIANWLPSLLIACYTVVLKEEYMKTEQEIAQQLNITLQTVKNILRAEPSKDTMGVIEGVSEKEGKDMNVQTAGSVAKIAYRQIKNGLDDVRLSLELSKSLVKALDITWAYLILKKLKWNDFPIESPQDVKEKVKKVYIKGRLAEEILEELDYPINTPMELIKLIKENLKMYGLE